MKLLLTTAISLLAAFSLQAAPNVLSIRQNVCDSAIIYPESFEVDTKKMRENWYLRNFAVIDEQAEKRISDELPPDEVLIERLSKMPTSIEMPFNSVVRNYIQAYAIRRRQLVENMLGLSLYYMPIFEEALDRYGMPLELRYLPVIESALDPNAVSRVGATGLWQFMLPTARGLNLEVNSLVDQRRDPYASSDAAARYLKELYQTFGDWSLAIAAYNCGPGNINKAMRRAGGGKKDFWEIYPYLPSETRGYVPAFIAANYIMNYYPLHGISPALARRPVVTDTVKVSRHVHFDQISEVLNIPKDEIRALNPQFRQDDIPGDIRPYALVLPSLQSYAYAANEDSIVNHRAADFARRRVVEPATIQTTGSDSNGEYIQEEIVQYHKVRKGETLTKIARRYGVTVESIRKTNKCGKTVKTGSTLKIVTYKRKYVEKPKPEPETTVPADTTAVTPAEVPDAIESAIINAADQEEPGNMSDGPDEEDMEVDISDLEVGVDPEAETPAPTPEPSATPAPEAGKTVADAMTKSKQAEAAKQAEQARKPEAKPQAQPARPQRHTVARGENLFKISQRYGVTVDALRKANNITGDKIQVGQRLTIPAK